MQGIYNYIRDTNHVSRVYSVELFCIVTIYGTCNAISHVECFVLLH
jgi:hypothetical protein